MAKIPLRAYVKDIERLIERGEIEQAVSHAKNILKSYPKHIDTYRLLGKAFLESQRYSEAADILQRVLSVIPDDFVSQIGMSIIREDEGNLDAAIWHMERAYEIQPFNPAVQDELRRLYGRRDGVEPPKIRLTRGALVRMYARGELYPQAIAETRAALAEDAQRLDLQVLLARLYFLSGQKIEATEISSALLSKLPYCLEANRILTEVLPGTNRAEDAPKFQARINALDPYAAFVSPSAPTVDQVPDQAVMVEQYIWDAAMASAEEQSPDWARNIGIQWEESKEEELPDWLDSLKPQAAAPAQNLPAHQPPIDQQPPSPPEAPAVETQPGANEDLIPDWMKSAGWAATDRKADDIMAEAYAQEEETPGEIAPAEIPDWLKSSAPEGAEEPPAEAERDTWLESLFEPPSSTNGKNAETIPPLTVESGEQEVTSALPDWLSTLGKEEGESQALPGWPGSEETGPTASEGLIADQAPADELPQEPQAFEAKANELPDWGLLTEAGEEKEEPASPDITPDWLKRFETEEEQPGEPAAPAGTDWMASFAAPAEEEAQPASDIPDWLKSMESEEPASAEQAPEDLASAPEELAAAPEELAAFTEQTQMPAPEEEAPEAGLAQKTDIPDWLRSMEGEEAAIEESAAVEEQPSASLEPTEVEGAQPAGELPDWLKSLEPADETPVALDQEASVTSVETPASQFISGEETQPGIEPASAAEQPAETELPAVEQAVPDFSDIDAAMAWLEGLAAKQGADEETLKITRPEDRTETPPDWVQQMGSAATEEAAAPAGELVEPEVSNAEETAPAAQAEIPDWLKGLEPEQPAGEAPSAQEPVNAEAWFNEATDELPAASFAPQTQLPEAEELPEEEGLHPEQEQAVPAEEPLSIAAPEQPAAVELPAAEAASASEPAAPDLSDMDAAMAWLEALAAKQGADEETLKISRPEDRSEVPPEWIRKQTGELSMPEEPLQEQPQAVEQAAVEGLPAEEIPGASLTSEAEIPEWLQPMELESRVKEELPQAEQQPTAAEAPAAQEAAMPDLSDMDAAMAWLEALAAKQGADEETLKISRPEDRSEEPPEWIRSQTGQLTSLEPEEQPAAEEPQASLEQPSIAEEMPLPDWMQSALAAEGLPTTEGLPAAEELPDVEELPSEAFASQTQPPSEDIAEGEELTTTHEASQPFQAEEEDMDATFAWLESLAAKQGAQEGTLITAPEDRQEMPPEWVQKAEESAEAEAVAGATMPEAAAPEEPAVPELPEAEEPALPADIPAWLKDVEAPSGEGGTAWFEEEAAIQQPVDTGEGQWRPEFEEPAESAFPVNEPRSDWMEQAPQEAAQREEELPAVQEQAESEPVPDWLAGLEEEETRPKSMGTGELRSAWSAEQELKKSTVPSAQPVEGAGGLTELQSALKFGDLDRALDGYERLILNGEHLEETIHDLRDALYQFPVDVSIWQTLGDAYARNNQLQEALDAYTKAEELLR